MKKKIFNIIQIGNKDDLPSRLFDIFIAAAIFVNITVMFLLTFDELASIYDFLYALEFITLGIFIVEYGLRIWTSDLLFPDTSRLRSALRFIISADGIIELLTILPFFYLSGFVAFRMLRVVRIFHLFRINSQYDSFNVIVNVFREKANQIIFSVFIIIMLILAASLGMYSAEHTAQPEAFRNAFSGVWWAVSCLLTVGYGDIYPVTVAGKIMAIITAFLGVGVVAIPTGIISAGFVEQYSRIKQLKDLTHETSLNFVTINITHSHSWNGLCIKDAHLPQGLLITMVLRDAEVMLPDGNFVIKEKDQLILAAEAYIDEADLKLIEREIPSTDDWVGCAIKDLDLSRLTKIVSIQRHNKIIIPNGNTVIQAHDRVITYTKPHPHH